MKTDVEIREEAERIERLAREWIVAGGTKPEPATLAVLPESRIGKADSMPRRLLRIEIARDADAPEFLLIQDEDAPGRPAGLSESLVLTRSDSAYDVLRDGYELREQERLADLLAPVAERIEEDGAIEDASPEMVEEIAAMLDADQLTPSARLRARSDIAEFLEGRLGASDFISAVIERQAERPRQGEVLAEFLNERISVA